jgi:8-oxo-dGTP pyrophosphatase MutT (NUDIX family)
MNKNLWALIAGLVAVGTVKKKIGSFAGRKSTLDGLGFWGSEAAGIMFVCPQDNTILLGHRSRMVREPGTAGIFGGKVDPWDTSPMDAAVRETEEETGGLPPGRFIGQFVFTAPNFKYTTYVYELNLEEKMKWEPILNWENDDAVWYALQNVQADKIDIPVHFGVMHIMNNHFDELSNMIIQKQRRSGSTWR